MSLPSELIDIVVDHLHDDGEALRSCSLVSKAWMYSSRYHLFSVVEVTSQNCNKYPQSSLSTLPLVARKLVLCQLVFGCFRRTIEFISSFPLLQTLEPSMVAWVAMEDIPASLRSSPDFQGLDDDFSMIRELSELSLSGKDGFTALPPVSTFLMYGLPTDTLPKLGTIVQRLSESLEHLLLNFWNGNIDSYSIIPAEVLKVKYAINLYSLTLLDGLPEDLHLLLQQCQHAHLNEVALALSAHVDRPDMLCHYFWKPLDSLIMDPKAPFRLSSLTLGFYDWCPIQCMAETTKSVCLPLCAAAGIIQVVSERDYPFNTRRRMEIAKPTHSGKKYGSLCSVGAT